MEGFPANVSYEPPKNRPREFYVIDFETTGLDSATCEITEIAVIRVFANKVVGQFSTLVACDKHIPESVAELTGIDDTALIGAPSLEEAATNLGKFIKKKVPLFAHNAPFDAKFIWANRLADYINVDCPICDSIELAKRAFPAEASYSLDNLAKSLSVHRMQAHRALGDVLCTAQVIDMCYAKEEGERGIAQFGYQTQLGSMFELPSCPRCNSVLIAKDGFTQAGTQMYRCVECGKKYSGKNRDVARTSAPKSISLSEARAKHGDGLLHCPYCESSRLITREHQGRRHCYQCKDCKKKMTFREDG